MIALQILALARRFWPVLAGAGILICAYLYIQHVAHEARSEQYAIDKAVIDKLKADARSTTQAARLADLAHARAVETAQAKGTENANAAMAPMLADYRQRLAAYVLRNPAPRSGQGGGGIEALSGTPDRPNVADSAGPRAVVDVSDLDICTENTGRLLNIQPWWHDQTKVAR